MRKKPFAAAFGLLLLGSACSTKSNTSSSLNSEIGQTSTSADVTKSTTEKPMTSKSEESKLNHSIIEFIKFSDKLRPRFSDQIKAGTLTESKLDIKLSFESPAVTDPQNCDTYALSGNLYSICIEGTTAYLQLPFDGSTNNPDATLGWGPHIPSIPSLPDLSMKRDVSICATSLSVYAWQYPVCTASVATAIGSCSAASMTGDPDAAGVCGGSIASAAMSCGTSLVAMWGMIKTCF